MFELNQVIKLFSCSAQLNVEFIMLINVEMTMVKSLLRQGKHAGSADSWLMTK